ncbi:murein L,D-transpeptidase [candidate division KSB1 bacterium]
MPRKYPHFIRILCLLSLICSGAAQGRDISDQVREYLRDHIEAAGYPLRINVAEEIIHSASELTRFYEKRTFRPAWIQADGPSPNVELLMKALREAYREGLNPDDYHLTKIVLLHKLAREHKKQRNRLHPLILTDLELLLTDAFLFYGTHLLAGKVDPEEIDTEWFANRRSANLVLILESAVKANQIGSVLASLKPRQPGYRRLKEALEFCRKMESEGGWPEVPPGPNLSRGARGRRVEALYARLRASNDIKGMTGDDPNNFDDRLDKAIRHFQRRHGLGVDGIFGPLTRAAMNVPMRQRIHQIETNLDRWRWLPDDLGERYIIINIASFRLNLVEKGRIVMTMRAVVGTDYRRTPVFSSEINYLVFNPYWNVPEKLAVEDLLPAIVNDPGYLAKRGIRVLRGWAEEQLDPSGIDWPGVTAENISFRLRQNPGPLNPLGKVKFVFPNKFGIYLHDTPSHIQFQKTERTFSSGCIRIEDPLRLAEYLLRDDGSWNMKGIKAAIAGGEATTAVLSNPIRIYIQYWTAWTDEDGTIQFRTDIYDRDPPLLHALKQRSPTLD